MTALTPSPQSVVVPREPTRVLVLKSAVERLILAADMYGVAHLDSDDMDDDAVELQDATEGMKDALAAAPAPSSLAGGEEAGGWLANPAYNPLPGGLIDAQMTSGHVAIGVPSDKYFWALSDPNDEVKAWRPHAALSPEAPSREVSEWFGVTGASDETEALAVALFDARCPGIRMTDEDLHYYRAAAHRAMKTVADELDTPALTPRHEAEGAGEREAFEVWYCADANRHGLKMKPSDVSSLRDGNEYGDRLALNSKWEGWQARARSSAPEAREGEAVAWRCSRDHASDGNGQWFYHDGPPNPSHLARNVQPLYTHPAAPSADKLWLALGQAERQRGELRKALGDVLHIFPSQKPRASDESEPQAIRTARALIADQGPDQ